MPAPIVARRSPARSGAPGRSWEQYLRAAQQAFRHCRPQRAIVLGLRSIGTSLASVVEAYLQRRSCHATSYVVRPRGEPFARTLDWDEALQAELRAKTDAHFFLVDEGPGRSGSSLTSVALALRQLGIEAARIVFLPGYSCDGSHFVNQAAQRVWRELGAEGETIACHPQHERRKYLAIQPSGKRFMLRFAGFGSHGRRVLERAQALEPSGVTPRVLGFGDGMLALEHIPAKISAAPPTSSAELARGLGNYLAFRRTRLEVEPVTTVDVVAEMAHQNISEAFGPSASASLAEQAGRARSGGWSASITDGRLLPHEWLATPSGLKKVDAFDHGDDHFFPGPCDAAWDVAGAIAELSLDGYARQTLISCYASAAGDAGVAERLPFFELAYLAHRLGYVTMAAGALGTTGDGAEFQKLERRYRRALGGRLRDLHK